MSEPVHEEERPILQRWGVPVAITGVIATVIFGVAALVFEFRASSDNNSGSTGRSPSTTTGSGEEAPRTFTEDRAVTVTTDPEASTGQVLLGLDIPLFEMDDCNTPPAASGAAWQLTPVRLGGKDFAAAYSCNIFSGGTGGLDFLLERAYRELAVTIGFLEGSSVLHHEIRFVVLGDGHRYLMQPRVVKYGEVLDLRVNVAEVSRLRLQVSEISDVGGDTKRGPSTPVWAGLALTPTD